MEYAGVEEAEKYRKYIQKRRVAPAGDEGRDGKPKPEAEEETVNPDGRRVESEPYILWEERESNSARFTETDTERIADIDKPAFSAKTRNAYNSSLSVLHRTDPGLYRKLYSGSGHKSQAYPSVYKSYSANRAQVEDNRVTLFAVKLIKQALACFAILGIILFMQSRPDMKDALAVVKQQVVDTNIEPQSIYEGIVGIINQISGTLGGSP